jgi:succinate dehydrogenase/fumarate reductase flavoprotein subunit
MELAPRDIVARAEQSEMDAGRGVDGKDMIHLDLRHLGKARIMERLPQIRQLGIDFLGVDCITDCLPIQPTAHYSMGGIPTDKGSHVIVDEQGTRMKGFFAAGECACVSVHGGNRLGTNSLLDAVVFGERAGKSVLEYAELGNMLGVAQLIATAALRRKESRGGHFRTDFPKRDDKNFLHHSMVYDSPDGLVIKEKPVVITKHQPAERTY